MELCPESCSSEVVETFFLALVTLLSLEFEDEDAVEAVVPGTEGEVDDAEAAVSDVPSFSLRISSLTTGIYKKRINLQGVAKRGTIRLTLT